MSSRQLKIAKEKILKENANKYFFGNRPTKEFFDNFKRKTNPNSKIIYEMKDKNDNLMIIRPTYGNKCYHIIPNIATVFISSP